MPILVKGDDVRSGAKATARHGLIANHDGEGDEIVTKKGLMSKTMAMWYVPFEPWYISLPCSAKQQGLKAAGTQTATGKPKPVRILGRQHCCGRNS